MRNSTYPKAPFAAQLITTAGGAATESLALSGVEAGDICIVQIQTEGAVPVTVKRAECVANAVSVEFSADPSSDHVLNVVVFKAA